MPHASSPILVVSSRKDADGYTRGVLSLNGQPDPDGADLDFRLLIALPWNDVRRDIANRIGEDPAFFAVYVLLLSGCGRCLCWRKRWGSILLVRG